MRSSCEASAMKRRRRSWLASRSANASSSRSSMRLSASPRRPTSVRWSVVSTRWERSPPAIAAAVWPMRSSGSRPMRTTTSAKAPISTSTPTITMPSTSSSRSSVWLVARAGSRRRHGAVARGLGEHAVVALRGLDGLGSSSAMSGGQLGLLAALVGAEEPARRARCRRVAQLAVGVARRAAAGRRAAAARAAAERRLGVVDLVLDRRRTALRAACRRGRAGSCAARRR